MLAGLTILPFSVSAQTIIPMLTTDGYGFCGDHLAQQMPICSNKINIHNVTGQTLQIQGMGKVLKNNQGVTFTIDEGPGSYLIVIDDIQFQVTIGKQYRIAKNDFGLVIFEVKWSVENEI